MFELIQAYFNALTAIEEADKKAQPGEPGFDEAMTEWHKAIDVARQVKEEMYVMFRLKYPKTWLLRDTKQYEMFGAMGYYRQMMLKVMSGGV